MYNPYGFGPVFQSDFDAKWVESKEQAINTQVLRDTIFMDKNQPIFYMKSPNTPVKAYEFIEHIEINPKDKEIAELKARIEKLEKGGMNNEQSVIQPVEQHDKQSDSNDKQV